jgi:hypothetical protein
MTQSMDQKAPSRLPEISGQNLMISDQSNDHLTFEGLSNGDSFSSSSIPDQKFFSTRNTFALELDDLADRNDEIAQIQSETQEYFTRVHEAKELRVPCLKHTATRKTFQ